MKPIEPGCLAIIIVGHHRPGSRGVIEASRRVGEEHKVWAICSTQRGMDECDCLVWETENSYIKECWLLRIDGHDEEENDSLESVQIERSASSCVS